MRWVLLAVVALGATTSAAVAEPKKLTDADLGNVAAGFLGGPTLVTAPTTAVGPFNVAVAPVGPVTVLPQLNVSAQTAIANAVGVFNKGVVDADAGTVGNLNNFATADIDSLFTFSPVGLQ